VLRGTKQRPDIREQSNLVAKEQSACKEEESIYGRSPHVSYSVGSGPKLSFRTMRFAYVESLIEANGTNETYR